MVRRWSYINFFNSQNLLTKFKLQQFISLYYIKETRYFHLNVLNDTFFHRSQWSRIKHLKKWVLTFNLIVLWAREYRFVKKYTYFTYSLFFFKNNLVFFNYKLVKYNLYSLNPINSFFNKKQTPCMWSSFLVKNRTLYKFFSKDKWNSFLIWTFFNPNFFNPQSTPFSTEYPTSGILAEKHFYFVTNSFFKYNKTWLLRLFNLIQTKLLIQLKLYYQFMVLLYFNISINWFCY